MQRIPDLVGVEPIRIFWTENFGTVRLLGNLRPPYTDNWNLEPHLQVWDLLMNMFQSARNRFGRRNVRFVLRLGTGVQGANRYNYNNEGRLKWIEEENRFNQNFQSYRKNDRLQRYIRYSRHSFAIRLFRINLFKQVMTERFSSQILPIDYVFVCREMHRLCL